MNGISPELTGAAIDVAMMKKQKDMIEQQGEAAVELIQSSGNVAPPPAQMVSPPGIGSLIDVYI
ncbi:MAG: putative motility protein [Deltaproteobacteria bacterium]|nr:putative motility protein [Deltaproteobacteria bacterium]MBN2671745.1 putative motility protein [Deltaproteobacteria bacterium]